MALVTVFAGPNGSGKTTLATAMRERGDLPGEWINADEIAQHTFGDWNDPANVLAAAQEADRRRDMALAERRDFSFETVLSTPRKLEFLERARAAGMHITCRFIATEDPAINVRRVAARRLKGGHDVPVEKIVSRYHRSLANLPRLIRTADRVIVLDNSAEGREPIVLAEFAGGSLRHARDDVSWFGRLTHDLAPGV